MAFRQHCVVRHISRSCDRFLLTHKEGRELPFIDCLLLSDTELEDSYTLSQAALSSPKSFLFPSWHTQLVYISYLFAGRHGNHTDLKLMESGEKRCIPLPSTMSKKPSTSDLACLYPFVGWWERKQQRLRKWVPTTTDNIPLLMNTHNGLLH